MRIKQKNILSLVLCHLCPFADERGGEREIERTRERESERESERARAHSLEYVAGNSAKVTANCMQRSHGSWLSKWRSLELSATPRQEMGEEVVELAHSSVRARHQARAFPAAAPGPRRPLHRGCSNAITDRGRERNQKTARTRGPRAALSVRRDEP